MVDIFHNHDKKVLVKRSTYSFKWCTGNCWKSPHTNRATLMVENRGRRSAQHRTALSTREVEKQSGINGYLLLCVGWG